MTMKKPVNVKFCKNFFDKHEKSRRGSFKKISNAIYTAFSSFLQSGESLCETCRVLCYRIMKERKDLIKNGQFPSSIEDYVINIQQEQESIIKSEKSKSVAPLSEEAEPMEIDSYDSDSANEFIEADDISDEDFRLSLCLRQSEVLVTVNKLCKQLGIDIISTDNKKNSKVMREKLNTLLESLSNLFLKDFEYSVTHNSSDFERRFAQDLKMKYDRAQNYSEKINILLFAPPTWGLHEMQKKIGCSLHAARESKILRETETVFYKPVQRNRSSALTDVQIKTITDFFFNFEISRVCPAVRDTKTVKIGQTSEKLQKRLLLHNMKEIFALFTEEYGKILGFSTFCRYRPPECILVDESKGFHNVCVCICHQNVKLLLDAVLRIIRKFKWKEHIPLNYREILEESLCSKPEEACHFDECFDCPGVNNVLRKILDVFQLYSIRTLECKQWATISNRCQLIDVQFTKEEFIKHFRKNFMKDFRLHNYIAKSQSDFVRKTIENLRDDELVVMLDFAENYTCTHQDEVQAAHWRYTQVTVHSFFIYRKVNGNVEKEAFVIISENLEHNVQAVSLFQEKLISYIKEKNYNVRKIFYVSDGAAAQYKNRYNFFNLAHHYQKYSILAEWHFFASYHGKSPCDGVGGTVKRLARRASLQGKCINNALELYEWARSALPNMTFAYCTNEEHVEITKLLQPDFAKTKTINGTQSCHAFIPLDEKQIKIQKVSYSSEFLIQNVM